MPLNINDELLDQLESMSDEEAAGVFSSLQSHEQDELMGAVERRKSLTAAAQSIPLPAQLPTAQASSAEQPFSSNRPAIENESSVPTFSLEGGMSVGHPNWAAYPPSLGERVMGKLRELGDLEQRQIRGVQATVGAPLAEAGMALQDKLRSAVGLENTPEGDYWRRQTLTALGGPDLLKGMDRDTQVGEVLPSAQVESQSRERLGDFWHDLLAGTAQEAPTFFIPGLGTGASLAAKASGAAGKAVARVGGEAVEQALIGAASAQFTGQDPAMAALAGGVGGAAIASVKPIAQLTRRAGEELASGIGKWIPKAPEAVPVGPGVEIPSTVVGGVRRMTNPSPDVPTDGFTPVAKMDDIQTPLEVTVFRADDGTWMGRVAELDTQGNKRAFDVKLDNASAVKLNKFSREKLGRTPTIPTELRGHLPESLDARLLDDPVADAKLRKSIADREAKRINKLQEEAKSAGPATGAGGPRSLEGKPRAKTDKLPSADEEVPFESRALTQEDAVRQQDIRFHETMTEPDFEAIKQGSDALQGVVTPDGKVQLVKRGELQAKTAEGPAVGMEAPTALKTGEYELLTDAFDYPEAPPIPPKAAFGGGRGGGRGGGGGSNGGGGGKNGGGGKKLQIGQGPSVPPPDPVAEGPFIGPLDEATDRELKLVDDVRKKVPNGNSTVSNLIRDWVGNQWRGPKTLGSLIARAQAASNLARYKDDVMRAIREKFPKMGIDSEFDRDIGLLAEGKLTGDQMLEKHGEAWGRGRKYIEARIQEKEALDAHIAALGGIPDDLIDLRDSGAIDQYLAKMYRLYAMPKGKWAELVHQDVVRDAAEYIWRKKGGPKSEMTKEQLALRIRKILKEDDPLFELMKLSKNPNLNLIRRQEIPAPIRKLLGEETSGAARLAQSLGNQKAIIANLEMWQDAIERGIVRGLPDLATGMTKQIPNNPRMYGKAAGMYTNAEAFDALVTVPLQIRESRSWIDAIVGSVKGNLVTRGGLRPFVNNFMGNFWYSTLAGLSPLTLPSRTAKYMYRALNAMAEYRNNPEGMGIGAIITAARRHGVDAPSWAAVEITGPESKLMRELEEKLLADRGDVKTIAQTFGGWASKLYNNSLGKVNEQLGRGYDLIDRTFKLANFMHLRDKFIKKGMTVDQAEEAAAYRVRASFPNPQNLGVKMDQLRRGAFSVAAPFLSFRAEDVRINGMLLKRLANAWKDEPELYLNLLGTGVITYGIFSDIGALGELRRANGITDEEVEAAMLDRTTGRRAYSTLATVAPWRNKDGSLDILDPTQWFSPGTYLSGHPDDSWWQKAVANLLNFPVEGSLLGDASRGLMENTGLVRPAGFEPKPWEGQRTPGHVATQIAGRSGLVPRAITDTIETERRAGNTGTMGKYEEPLSSTARTLRHSGLTAQTYRLPTEDQQSQSHMGATMQSVSEVKQLLQQELTSIYTSKLPQAEKDKMAQAAIKRAQEIVAAMQQRNQAVNAAQKARPQQPK